jgi:arylformamidase
MDAEAEYNNRARVPGHPAVIEGWARDSAAFRAAWRPHAELGLPYGPGEREGLDLFLPGPGTDWPAALFMHGGYWQALDRSFVSHVARGMLARGVAVAVPSYDLCPRVTLGTIVAQMRAAAALVHRRMGGRRPLLATGHSAGGHLAALLLATGAAEWRALDPCLPGRVVTAALPVSGVFDLAPLLETSIGRGMGLSEAEARALSPASLPPPPGTSPATLHAAVGAEETAEFLRQSRDFAARWGGGWEALPGLNHFTVLAALADPASPLAARAAGMARALG